MKQHLHKSDMKLLNKANPAQMAAITHESGPVMCLAGPGSGKTFVLTQHIRYLIEKKHVLPHHILVITFSKAAAIHMKKRFYEIMDNDYYPVLFGTFHSIFFHILCLYENYKVSDILTNPQKKKYLKTVLFQMNDSFKMDLESLETILDRISYVKTHSINNLSEIDKEIPYFKEIYSKYESLIRHEHKLDFDDMMILCHRLLLKRPDILEEYRKEIKYVLIDEYQDINPIQYELVKQLVAPHNNLFVVGDDDQSIYSFRGCNPGIMLSFKNEFPEGKIINFPINYRSTKNIVNTACNVISQNKKRYEKEYVSFHNFDIPVLFYGFKNKEEEYSKLIGKIKEVENSDILNETACLFRTNMDASCFAERLFKEKIPYQMKEVPYNPYEHFIAKDFLHYLYLKSGDKSVEHFIPVMNKPLRYINRDAINFCKKEMSFKQLKDFYLNKEYMLEHIRKWEYDLKRMEKMDVYAAINYIRKGIGYDMYLCKYANEMGKSAEELLKRADEIQDSMGKFTTLETLQLYIDNYREQITTIENINDTNKKNGVHIMTYHASKGLEFDNVFLADCNEGIIPYKKCITEEEIEEERRLFYVAMTRARFHLHIMYIDNSPNKRHMVSRFVKEAKRL